MKKIILPSLVAALSLSAVAKAELEISGNVTTMTVYQKDSTNATAAAGFGGATQGDLGIAGAAGADHFRFVVDQVELDLENEFGDNIRARADVDFRDVTNTTIRGADAIDLEQAYVTANIGVGSGLELLVGKFNSPLGLELNDRNENVFSTYTSGYAYTGHVNSFTGAKLYYEFNDNWSMDLGVINNIAGGFGSSAVPTTLFRLGAMWGEEGNESFIHLGVTTGPEAAAQGFKSWTHVGALWGNWSLGDFWDIGWEYTYRQNGAVGADPKMHTGQLYAVYQASDVWSVQARAHTLYEQTNGVVGTAVKDTVYGGTLGATYQIADDAQVKFEYRLDYANPTGAGNNATHHTGVAEFAYSF